MRETCLVYLESMASPIARPATQRLLEFVALAAFLAYATGLQGRVAFAFESSGDMLVLLAGVVCGYFTADLISGVAHWMGDRLGHETTPIIGAIFIAPFREHHDDPQEMVSHGLLELVGNTAVFALPSLAAAYYLLEFEPGSGWALFSGGLILSAMMGVVATNIFHRWAHMERPPYIGRILQGAGLVLTREHHARHHAGSFDRAYCITTGWMDRPLDRLRVWEQIECLLGRDRRKQEFSAEVGPQSDPSD